MSHTAESVFQMAFEEIYSSDAFTWHLQFHGNTTLRGGCVPEQRCRRRASHAPYARSEHRGGVDGRSGGRGRARRRRLRRGDDCVARGTDNMQMRFASGLPHASICATGNVPVGPSRFIHVEQRRGARRARPILPPRPGGIAPW